MWCSEALRYSVVLCFPHSHVLLKSGLETKTELMKSVFKEVSNIIYRYKSYQIRFVYVTRFEFQTFLSWYTIIFASTSKNQTVRSRFQKLCLVSN